MDGIIRGLHRRHIGRNMFRVDGVRGTDLNAHTPIHTRTHVHTREERTSLLNKLTLWANVLGVF